MNQHNAPRMRPCIHIHKMGFRVTKGRISKLTTCATFTPATDLFARHPIALPLKRLKLIRFINNIDKLQKRFSQNLSFLGKKGGPLFKNYMSKISR